MGIPFISDSLYVIYLSYETLLCSWNNSAQDLVSELELDMIIVVVVASKV